MGTEEVACSECNSDLIIGQKYCANCGIEIEWPDDVIFSSQTKLPISSTRIPSWIRKRYQALGNVGKVILLVWMLLMIIALWGLRGGVTSQDDTSECNGLYDANMLKTYGVFR